MATYVLAGTYDGNLYGWELEDPARHVAEGAEVPMALRIGTSAHIGSVKSIAVRKIKRGRVIVTGGEDENISVFDLERLRQVGTLNQHRGSINCFDFFEGTHMLSGGDDAQVALWRTSDWECIHVLAGHKAPVRSVALHPSGKLALSTSDDSTVRMWDLVQGRIAYIKKLALPADLVVWAPDGMHFAIASGNTVYIHRVADAEPAGSYEIAGRVYGVIFLSDKTLAVSGNEKNVHFCTIAGRSAACARALPGARGLTASTRRPLGVANTKFRTRVRAMSLCDAPPAEDDSPRCWIACASSDGFVQVWDVTAIALGAPEAGASAEAPDVRRVARTAVPEGVRLTCLSATHSGRAFGAASSPAEAAQQAVQAHNATVEATGAVVGSAKAERVDDEDSASRGEASRGDRGAGRFGAKSQARGSAGERGKDRGKGKGKGKGKKRARREHMQGELQDMDKRQRQRQLALEADSLAAAEHLG